MLYKRRFTIILSIAIALIAGAASAAAAYEDPADYPLMGDWQGHWVNPQAGHEKAHPGLCAQLLPVRGGSHYRVVLLPELYNRAEPYLKTEVPGSHQRVAVKQGSLEVVFEGAEVRGRMNLHGKPTEFVLKKTPLKAPSVGLKPPEGATILFDGSDYSQWQHSGGKDVTWDIVGDAMQTVTRHNKENSEKGLGGSIETRQEYGSMRFHMEFRYPVEAGKTGQSRGNSGLFFLPLGEVQILNSYTTPNYWNECGSIYKRHPAKVDAAGPPLEWQAYDVILDMPEKAGDPALLTVYLNGRLLHKALEMPTGADKVRLSIQDHVNIMQYRNIWLVEE